MQQNVTLGMQYVLLSCNLKIGKNILGLGHHYCPILHILHTFTASENVQNQREGPSHSGCW